jgi:hypothetical protein
MEQYKKMTDEQLAELAQSGNDDAFTELFKRYERALKAIARKAHLQYPSYYEDEFFGYIQEQFMNMVKTFKVDSGIYFAAFCKFKFPRLAYNYVRSHIEKRAYDEDGKKRKLDEPSVRDKHKVMASDLNHKMSDERFTYEFQQEIEDTDLFVYLKKKSDVCAKVVSLYANGYTLDEVAELMGKTGTYWSKVSWTSRVLKKAQRITLEFYQKYGTEDELKAYAN